MERRTHRSDRSPRAYRAAALSVVTGWLVLAGFTAAVLAPSAGAMGVTSGPASGTLGSGAVSAHTILHVPSQYATVQKAVNAAAPGGVIAVAAGHFGGSLRIGKSLRIVGAGAGRTVLQSPTNISPDHFGNSWAIEVGNGATVLLEGFTLRVALQCIHDSGVPRDSTVHPHVDVDAGGGIGVGGGANLTVRSAVVTTTGVPEGASCGPTSVQSFGTGIDFGLDYTSGSPAPASLVGTGTVVDVSVAGFGFGGPDISIGGQADSAAGSYALISQDHLATSAADSGLNDSPAISLGFGGNASSGTIVGDVISGAASFTTNLITAFSGSSVSIVRNAMQVGAEDDAILVIGGTADILLNTIAGSTADFSGGIILELTTSTVAYNALGNFDCAYNLVYAGAGLCGPSFVSQAQVVAIGDYADAGLGTTIDHNFIYHSDTGISVGFGCSACAVQDNLIVNSTDYALQAIDGNYSFAHDLIIGGLYGVGIVAFSANTTASLSHVKIDHPSAGRYYTETDATNLTATVQGR